MFKLKHPCPNVPGSTAYSNNNTWHLCVYIPMIIPGIYVEDNMFSHDKKRNRKKMFKLKHPCPKYWAVQYIPIIIPGTKCV